MNQRAIIILAGVFVLVIGGMFAYAYMKRAEMNTVPQNHEIPVEDDVAMTRVDAKHFYNDGIHTVAGEVMMPTPCDLLQTDSIVRESFPEQVTVAFTVVNHTDMCAQVVTAQRFKESFSASEDAVISGTWEGNAIILNLIEAGQGEDPDDFELFIKG